MPAALSQRTSLALVLLASLACSIAIWLGDDALAHWVLAQRAPGAPRIYPWQLAAPGFWSHATAWGGYVLHQATTWWLIHRAQAARTPWSDSLRPLNAIALSSTAAFVALHFVQTQLFYDGLAQDVPEWTAMWSVIVLLLVVILMENRRRGIAFGRPWGGFVAEAGGIARRYHGYYFSWATIYTFWYHPMVFTPGHALGFFYMFLLLAQGGLMFTSAHRNRWWTLTLELLVLAHGVTVALMNTDGMWHMFGFGLAGVFFVTQAFGLGWRRGASWALLGAYAAVLLAFYSQWGWQDFPKVFRILGAYYVVIPLLAGLIVLAARAAGVRPQAPSRGSGAASGARS
ncbi:MAG: hypothetical protein U1F11_02200 [Steroidobacteraceae bacterium]